MLWQYIKALVSTAYASAMNGQPVIEAIVVVIVLFLPRYLKAGTPPSSAEKPLISILIWKFITNDRLRTACVLITLFTIHVLLISPYSVYRATKAELLMLREIQPKPTTPVTDWQPPELPDTYTNIILHFAANEFKIPRPVVEVLSEGGASKKLSLTNVPEEFLAHMETLTNYSPRQDYGYYRAASNIQWMLQNHAMTLPIMPHIISNRLYIDVEMAFLNEKTTLSINE